MNKSIVLASIVYFIASVSMIFTIGHIVSTLPDDVTPFGFMGALLIYGMITGLFLAGLEMVVMMLQEELLNHDKP